MGTTWQEREADADEADDSPTVTAWNSRADIDLRDAIRVGAASEADAMTEALVHIAACDVDARTAQVFLRCWSTTTSGSFAASAAALSAASRSLRGLADADLLSIVDGWIDDLAPVSQQRRARLRHYFLGHASSLRLRVRRRSARVQARRADERCRFSTRRRYGDFTSTRTS